MIYKGDVHRKYSFSGINAKERKFTFANARDNADELDALAALLTNNSAFRYDATAYILQHEEILTRSLICDEERPTAIEYCLEHADDLRLVNKLIKRCQSTHNLEAALASLAKNKFLTVALKEELLAPINAELKAIAEAKAAAEEMMRLRHEALKEEELKRLEAEALMRLERAKMREEKMLEAQRKAEALAAAEKLARVNEEKAKYQALLAEKESLLTAAVSSSDPRAAFAVAEWYQAAKAWPEVGEWLQEALIRATKNKDEAAIKIANEEIFKLLTHHFIVEVDLIKAKAIVTEAIELDHLTALNWKELYKGIKKSDAKSLKELFSLHFIVAAMARPELHKRVVKAAATTDVTPVSACAFTFTPRGEAMSGGPAKVFQLKAQETRNTEAATSHAGAGKR